MSSLSQFNNPERRMNRLTSQVAFRIVHAGMTLGMTGLFLLGAVPAAQAEYTDIPAISPSAKYINYLAERQVISGYPDQTFRPYKPVTRAEFAVMLAKSQHLSITPVPKTGFKDIKKRHWASGAIASVNRRGWLKGYPGKTFRPNRRITRAEVYTVMAKLGQTTPLELSESDTLLSRYRDAYQIPSWAKVPLATAIQAGLATDDLPSQTLWPTVYASRADVATVLAKLNNPDFRTQPPAEPVALAQPVTIAEPVAKTEPIPTAKPVPNAEPVAAEPVDMAKPASTPTLQLKPAPEGQLNWLHELSEDIISNEPKKEQMAPPVLAKPVARLRHPSSIRRARSQNQQVVGLYFSNLDNLSSEPDTMIGNPAMRYFKGPDIPKKAIQALLSGPNETERKHGYFVDDEVGKLNLAQVQISKDGVASVVIDAPEGFEFKTPQASERLKKQIERTLQQFSNIKKTELSISGGTKAVSQTSP